MTDRTEYIDLLFRNRPGPDSDFVECDDDKGLAIDAGQWFQRSDRLWCLRIKPDVFGD